MKKYGRGVNEEARRSVAAELERQGVTDLVESRDLNRTVLKGKTPSGRRRTFLIKAKSERSKIWQATIRDGDRTASDQVLWIFVDLGGEHGPEYYVVPDRIARLGIKQRQEEYLRENGGHRPLNDDSTHQSIELERLVEWKDRWDLL